MVIAAETEDRPTSTSTTGYTRQPRPRAPATTVVCECALFIVPDKTAAVSEWHRILEPDGRARLADVVVVRERLDPRLGSLVGHVACLGRALPEEEYVQLLRSVGFEIVAREDHSESLAALVETVRRRLVALEATGLAAQVGVDLAAGISLADLPTRSGPAPRGMRSSSPSRTNPRRVPDVAPWPDSL